MNTKNTNTGRHRFSWLKYVLVLTGILLFAGEMFAQTYQVTMNQRRMGNKIGVEFWIKDVTSGGTAPKLGNTTIAVTYNTDFLVPDGSNAYSSTDSVDTDMDIASPFHTINSPFADAAYGYINLKGQPADNDNGSGRVYVHTLDVITPTGGIGYQPASTGRGTFLGMLKFQIKNYNSMTGSELTKIAFNTVKFVGDIVVTDINGNDVESQTSFVNQGDFTIRGVKLLNPNGPNQAVNRNPEPALTSLSPNKGYPVYFERSGLADTASGNNYGTSEFAYSVDYSLDGGATYTETARLAETILDAASMSNKDYYRANEVDTLNGSNTYFVTDGNGSALSVGYEGVLRFIWKANENFFARSEQAKLRINQLDTTGTNAAISSRAKLTSANRSDASDYTFVLGRLFFTQLNGTSQYLKSKYNYSNATQLTVEAWVNLNGYSSGQPAIVASSAGEVSPEEGAWMLYLKDGKYPAFRVREIEGRGPNGYLGEVVAADSLRTSSDASPISNSHSLNWTHIAATVNNGVVTLYVNGEIADQYTNTQSVNPRMLTTVHPIWIGVNPNGGITDGNYLHAGIKEVKVWRTALPQNTLRKRIAGVYDPAGAVIPLGSNTINDDERTALELYYTLQGSRLDAASDFTYQNSANPLNWYESPSISAVAVNGNINYRPDRSHIKLTSPIGGEGISNLKNHTFAVRWAGYGLGKTSAGSADLQIMASRDGGVTWFDAIDNQTPAMPLDQVEIEDYQALWSPYNNVTASGQNDDLQSPVPVESEYSKSVILKISGTEARNQSDIYDVSQPFTVAPNFALKLAGNDKVTIKNNTQNLNLSTGTSFIEAWIRPYRFPTTTEAYFPIISKQSDATGNDLHYALRLLPTGQLQLAVASSTGDPVRIANSALALPMIQPNVVTADSAWYHVGAYVNLANGGISSVRFYIDGRAQYEDSISTQLDSNITINRDNTYPMYFGYEPGSPEHYFVGEMKEVRLWGGNPGGQAPANLEPSALTLFVQGAATVRADELTSVAGTDYTANLLAAFSFNGGGFVPTGYLRSASGIPASNSWVGYMSGNGYKYVATKPYIKVVEPYYAQSVANTKTDLKVRWTGFDWNRNNLTTFRNGSDGVNNADLQFSELGGGGLVIQPYQYVASQKWSAGYTNAMTLIATNSVYEFPGTTSKSQFAANLNVSVADPDVNNDAVYTDQGPLGATQNNGRLKLTGRTTINGVTLEYDNSSNGVVPTLSSESALFNITPPSNFTIRTVLEGRHVNGIIQNDLGDSYAHGGLKITLYQNNAGQPGAAVDSAESAEGYYNDATALDPTVSPARNIDGSKYADVPFVFTTITSGRYFVKVDNINHLPVMSRYAAPFNYSGDDLSTWAIESGWDFQNWDGSANAITETDASAMPPTIGTKYAAAGYYETNKNSSNYASTGLAYNYGQNSTGTTQIAAMVAGDVVKDGNINALDRARIMSDNGGSDVAGDVTGDGVVNATDRTIVYRNSGKSSSLIAYPQVNSFPDVNSNSTLTPNEQQLAAMFEKSEQDYINNGGEPVHQGQPTYKENRLLSGGIAYKVSATPVINGDVIDVPLFIQNTGDDWGLGNATFGIQYDPNVMRFVSLEKTSDVIFDSKDNLGYLAEFTTPTADTKDPITDIRTIDVNYNNYESDHKPGTIVPKTSTYLGTLRFQVINPQLGYFFKWHKITAVHSTDGVNVTNNGTFEPIQPIVLAKAASVVEPNGGEVWSTQTLYTITWNAPTTKTTFNIDYSVDNGATWNRITNTPVVSDVQAYNWVTPKVSSTECLVRLVDAVKGTEVDRSDATFTIKPGAAEITRPSTGDAIYQGGVSDVIKWTLDQNQQVRFEFSDNGNDNWVAVSTTVNSSLGQINWTVPVANTKNAVVRMINAVTNDVIAESTPFRVLAGTLTLTNPNAKSVFQAGEKQAIRWNYNNVNKFDLQFSADGGANWKDVASNVSAMNKKYDWIVEKVNTSNALIRAIYNGQPELTYNCTEAFKIEGPQSVDPTSEGYAFSQPVPNPFADDAQFSFTLPTDQAVTITVINNAGMTVKTLVNAKEYSAGTYNMTLSGNDLPNGTYFIILNAGGYNMMQPIIRVK